MLRRHSTGLPVSNPELSRQEHRTTARIKEILASLGIKLQPLDIPTGAAGLVTGKAPGKTLGIRADIDALPMQELSDASYRSKTDGIMHSCGHDAHNTVLLGVAHKLMESGLADRIKGQVKLVFQPAEEVATGAKGHDRGRGYEKPGHRLDAGPAHPGPTWRPAISAFTRA